MRQRSQICVLAATLALAALAACSTTSAEQSDTHSSIQDNEHATTPPMGAQSGGAQSGGAQGGAGDMQLPPGWTMEDMQACKAAGTPGKMHEHLAKEAGTWKGKMSMWMAPGTEPMKSECTSTITPILGARYTKCEMDGEMPGMGPYHGMGFTGFDNVSQKFVSCWFDNAGTGMMHGTGDLSADGKTLTWIYTYNCPIRKGPAKMREIHRMTGDNTMTLETYSDDPKTGKEYKMMEIEFTRTRT